MRFNNAVCLICSAGDTFIFLTNLQRSLEVTDLVELRTSKIAMRSRMRMTLIDRWVDGFMTTRR